MRLVLLLVAISTSAAAQTPETGLAVTWSASERWLTGRLGEAGSDLGAIRGRIVGSGCRSSIGPEGDAPVVVRFDTTVTTRAGRALSGLVVDAGTVAGAAFDISDPAQPRRLNLVFRDVSPSRDSVWTAATNEPLWVMASTYDGTGQTYAGRSITGETLDCLYSVRMSARGSVPPHTPNPLETRVRPALVRALTATGGSRLVRLTWDYGGPDGVRFRIRRTEAFSDDEAVVAEVPISARAYNDAAATVGTVYRYRVEAVDAGGAAVHTSVLSAEASASDSRNLDVTGRLDVGRGGSDIWGYVAPDGREYAVLNAAGLTLIDVSGSTPVEVSHVPGGESDIEVAGRYAYVSGNSSGVQVIDLADPAAPAVVRTFAGHPDEPATGVHTLSVADGYLYLSGNVGGLSIWSLADPAAPVYVGAYRPESIHDVYVRGDTLYAALIYGGGVDIVDIRDRANPVRIANINYPGSGAHNVCMTEDGSHIFVGDEVGTGRWTRVFDVRDPFNVELVAEIIVDPDATVHNCHVRGDLLYLAHYELGVRVWDVSDPATPAEVAFSIGGGADTDLVWTAWPFLPSGKILASDISSGLVVLRLDESVAGEAAPVASAAALGVAPNPTAGAVRLSFALDRASSGRLTLHDVLGREVAVLASGPWVAGAHEVRWDAQWLPAGVYVARLVAAGGTRTARVTVAR